MRYLVILFSTFIYLFAYYPKYPIYTLTNPTLDIFKDKFLIDGFIYKKSRFSFKKYPFNHRKSYFLDENRILYSNTSSLCIYNLKDNSQKCKEFDGYIDALAVSKKRDYYAVGSKEMVYLYFKNRLYKTFKVEDKIREIIIKNGKIYITYTPKKSGSLLDGYIAIYTLDGYFIFKNKIGKFSLYPIVTNGKYLFHTDGNNVYVTNIYNKKVARGTLVGDFIFQDMKDNIVVASSKKELYLLKTSSYKGDTIIYPDSSLYPINLKVIKRAKIKEEIKALKIINDKIFILYKMGAFDIVDFNLKPTLSYKPKKTDIINSIFITKNSDLIIGYGRKIFKINKNFKYKVYDTNCSISTDIIYVNRDDILFNCDEKKSISSFKLKKDIALKVTPQKVRLEDNNYYIAGKRILSTKYIIESFDSNFTKVKSYGFYPKKDGYFNDFFIKKRNIYLLETNWDKSYLEDKKEIIHNFKEQGSAIYFDKGYIVYDSVEKSVVVLDKNFNKISSFKTKYKISAISANSDYIFIYQYFNPYEFLTLYRLNGKKIYDLFLFSDNSFIITYPNKDKVYTTKKENLKYLIKP